MEASQDSQRQIELETRNGLSQFDETIKFIDRMDKSLAITPEIIKLLHEKAMDGLRPDAGSYRTFQVKIRGSNHKPPPHDTVAGLVEQMCDDANTNEWDSIKTSAFLLWRLNWIHPFGDGNGRTSRVISYLALCVRLGKKLPGKPTIPEQLTLDRNAYYVALADADAAWRQSVLDVGKLEMLLQICLEKQLSYLDDQA